MITVFGSINADLIFKLGRIPVPAQTLIAHSLTVQPGGKGLDDVRVVPEHATGCASICTNRDGRNQIAVALGANGHLSARQVSAAMLRPASSSASEWKLPAPRSKR